MLVALSTLQTGLLMIWVSTFANNSRTFTILQDLKAEVIIDDRKGDGTLSSLAAYLPYSLLTDQIDVIMQFVDEESDYDDHTKEVIRQLRNA